jgi:pimeloyl-ACP methyl ester carboxylesterase
MREPFFFGAGGGVFGILDQPEREKKKDCGVVICGSLGQEYIRSHRAIRELAKRMAREGYPVLRFDYRGCGDSLGECDEARLGDWREDIVAAILRMQSRYRPRELCVIGFRLGASLAMELDPDRLGFDRLCLWEPVVRGSRLLEELRALHRRHEAEWQPSRNSSSRRPEADDPSGTLEAMGFEFSKEMQQDIAAIDLVRLEGKLPGDVLLIENAESEDGSQLRERLRAVAPGFERIYAEEALVWLSEPFQSVVPQATIAAIFDWLAQERKRS